MRNLHVYILAAVLTVIGLAVFAYKAFVIGLPLAPGALASAWEVEKRISFEGTGEPVKLTVKIPRKAPGVDIIRESVVAPNYGTSKSKKGDNRELQLSARKVSGPQTIFVRSLIYIYEDKAEQDIAEVPEVQKPELSEAQEIAARALLKKALAESSDTETLTKGLLQQLSEDEALDSITERDTSTPKDARKADAAIALLSLNGVAARRVNGIDLKSKRGDIDTQYWLEVFEDGQWKPFALESNEAGVPWTFLPWSRGSEPIATLNGGKSMKFSTSIIRLEQDALNLALARGKKMQNELVTFSLFSLPIASQDVYRVLLVVPLGIVLLVVLRNVIGFKSLGTFMPVLIALAFRETQLVWGIILFSTVVAMGLLFRFYLENLKLLLVPRLASVLIFVLLLMAVLSVFTNSLGFQRGLSVALFPMVIMAMTIERVSVIWDERGAAEAITQAIGSLAIATLCYLLMTLPMAEHLLFTFPELLLLLLAATVLLGRYTGYRLLELRRFRELAKE